MKILITRKDGKTFTAHGHLATDIDRHFTESHLSTVVELDGEKFKIGDIKTVADSDYMAAQSVDNSCGKCTNGWVEKLRPDALYPGDVVAVPCSCAEGDKRSVYVDEYKSKLNR